MNKGIFYFAIMVVSIFLTSGKSLISQTKLSGKWVIVVTKSDFGNLTADEAAAKEIQLVFKNDSIETNRSFPSKSFKETFSVNGSVLKSTLENSTKEASFAWIEKNLKFVITSIYNVTEPERTWSYKRAETYSISPDGKTLTVNRTTIIPDRTDIVIAVYEKR